MKQIIKENWRMRESNSNNWIEANIPGSVYNDLLSSVLMDDPFWREKEYKCLDIANKDYKYQTSFTFI